MNKQGTGGKRKNGTLKVFQKFEIIRRSENGESQREVMTSCNIGLSTVFVIKNQKDWLQLFMASSDSEKTFFMQQTLKEPKVVQLDKELYKWLAAVHSQGKPMMGPVIVDKFFYE
jgi:CENP-B N-terminal DNA-binding domain.